MKKNKGIIALVAIIFSLTLQATPASARNEKWLEARTNDNLSMMQYADENDRQLTKKAKSTSVDPDYTSWQALYTYNMPDGKTVSCTRGISFDVFLYKCTEQ